MEIEKNENENDRERDFSFLFTFPSFQDKVHSIVVMLTLSLKWHAHSFFHLPLSLCANIIRKSHVGSCNFLEGKMVLLLKTFVLKENGFRWRWKEENQYNMKREDKREREEERERSDKKYKDSD